jgi:hypothetical protein
MDELRCTMKDVRSLKMCSGGARKFFERHNLDWQDFIKNGIPAQKFIDTKDVMALKVVEVARGRQQ